MSYEAGSIRIVAGAWLMNSEEAEARTSAFAPAESELSDTVTCGVAGVVTTAGVLFVGDGAAGA